MDLTSKRTIKELLRKHNVRPKKYMGQNFLISRSVLDEFIKATNISKNDVVLEVGAGIGTVTLGLAKKAKRVIAVEKDSKLIKVLAEIIAGFKNVKIVEKDIRYFLNLESKIINQEYGYKLLGNVPFYLTNYLIRKFLGSENPPKEMTLIVQKEVAQRICAKPPHMNLLAVSVQYYGEPKIISYVSKKSFWPQPGVDAAIMRIKIREYKDRETEKQRNKRTEGPKNKEEFFRVVKSGFSHPRKYLVNNLVGKLKVPKEKVEKVLAQNKIDPRTRAENLTVKQWIAITEKIKS